MAFAKDDFSHLPIVHKIEVFPLLINKTNFPNKHGEAKKTRVTFFQRRPQRNNFSIERLFKDVREALPCDIEPKVAISRYPSRGIFKRLFNILEAIFRQGDVNHVTGDVHFLTLLLNKRRTILTIHDLVSMHRLFGIKKILFRFFWYWLPIQRSAIITVISEFTKEELISSIKVNPDKLKVVYDCVSEDFKPFYKPFNSNKPRILQIGTGPNKNINRLIPALHGINCHLRLVGQLDERQLLALQKHQVDFSSVSGISEEDVYKEYCQCDMVTFPSTYEGFGLPILEAMATGRPIVTSTIGPIPEVAGDAACLVDPFDTGSIREGILKVLKQSSYRTELVKRGFENIRRFRADKIAEQYAVLYRELNGEA